MTDRERVLMNIAVDTAGTVHNTMRRLHSGWQLRFSFDHPSPQFVPRPLAKAIGMEMVPGDIVRCTTNPDHRWGIAELVEWEEGSCYLLREIGGDALCRIVNEDVEVLRFMLPSRLYTGVKHRLHAWASIKAFMPRYNPDASHLKRCGGVSFEGDTLIIWSRAHIWIKEQRREGEATMYAQPRKFTLQWSNKTRLKDIVAAMREQGFGDEFEYGPEMPSEGVCGCLTPVPSKAAGGER